MCINFIQCHEKDKQGKYIFFNLQVVEANVFPQYTTCKMQTSIVGDVLHQFSISIRKPCMITKPTAPTMFVNILQVVHSVAKGVGVIFGLVKQTLSYYISGLELCYNIM
jgi:hypothetical protein